MNVNIERIQKAIQESINVANALQTDLVLLESLENIIEELKLVYSSGGKLLIAGNGGSAADAQHFAAEITCQYQLKRKGRPAIALSTDTSALTEWSNDHSYDSVFARLVEAYGVFGDALVVISTSGNSKNLIQATVTARARGIKVFGLLGHAGGTLRGLCDVAIVVPSEETPRIQECHILIIHSICDTLDNFFHQEDFSKK